MVRVIDFGTDWCSPCQMMDPIVEEVEEELKGQVEFEKVSVNEEMVRAQKYKVMSVPTFVIEKDGEEVDRKIGAMSKESFREWIKMYL